MQRFQFAAAFLALLLSLSCSRLRRPVSALDHLDPCRSAEGPTDAYCGKVEVWEDRSARTGRKITLKVIVLPGLRREPAPDPLFFLAGGPGSGAAKMVPLVREIFHSLQTDRDLVFVDQRGTGDSNPLECHSDDTSLEQDPQAAIERLRACLATYQAKADVRRYTTPIAMDDLDDVRRFLGYGKINLYGGSYGSRAAIVYTRQHADSVRAVILDGVAPTDMKLPLYVARDGQRALDLLFRDCERDSGCHQRFPAIGERFHRLLARLDARPERVRVIHPRTGVEQEITVKRRTLTAVIFTALYSPQAGALVPFLIERAEKNDFQGFLALSAANGDLAETQMAQGMHFSVVCSEDAPRVTADAIQHEAAGTFLGAEMADLRMKPCEFWPRLPLDTAYYEIPRVDIPALILSGELDPVTPPAWGQQVADQWKNSRHIVIPGTGHGAISTGCAIKMMRQFLNDGSAAKLDVECVQRVHRPPFFLGPSGPDPQENSGL